VQRLLSALAQQSPNTTLPVMRLALKGVQETPRSVSRGGSSTLPLT
jgi:hypothetical protein